MIYQGSKKIPAQEIIVHCSATRPDWWSGRKTSQKVAEIRNWHVRDRGWRDIGYHWLIDRDGTVAKGREETVIGAHVAGHNSGTIGICLLGGHGSDARDRFAEHFTSEQDAALRKLIREIQGRTQIKRISGHNEYAAKACPGFLVEEWLRRGAERPAQAQPAARAPAQPKPQPAAPAPRTSPLAGLLKAIGALRAKLLRRK